MVPLGALLLLLLLLKLDLLLLLTTLGFETLDTGEVFPATRKVSRGIAANSIDARDDFLDATGSL